jgi:hypothetical protein
VKDFHEKVKLAEVDICFSILSWNSDISTVESTRNNQDLTKIGEDLFEVLREDIKSGDRCRYV